MILFYDRMQPTSGRDASSASIFQTISDMGTTGITVIMVITTDTDTTLTWSRSQVPKSCQKKMKKKKENQINNEKQCIVYCLCVRVCDLDDWAWVFVFFFFSRFFFFVPRFFATLVGTLCSVSVVFVVIPCVFEELNSKIALVCLFFVGLFRYVLCLFVCTIIWLLGLLIHCSLAR